MIFNFTLTLFISLTLSYGAHALESSCWASVKQMASARDQSLHERYFQLTQGASGLNKKVSSIFLAGRGDLPALVMLHGFPGKPQQFTDLARVLNEKYGFTVYAPVLTGFGGAAQVGNEIKLEDWHTDVTMAVALAGRCSNQVALVGYSMGGGIAIDVLFQSPQLPITNLVLISPLVKTKTTIGIKLAGFLRAAGLETFGSVSMKLVKQVERIMANLEAYQQSQEMIKTPTVLVSTANDGVIDPEKAEVFTFSKVNLVSKLIFPKELGITHNEILGSENPYLNDIADRIDYFLNR